MYCYRKEINQDTTLCRPPEEIQGLSVHQSDTRNLQTRDKNGVTMQTLRIHVHEATSAYTSLNQRLEQDTHFYEVISSSLTCQT